MNDEFEGGRSFASSFGNRFPINYVYIELLSHFTSKLTTLNSHQHQRLASIATETFLLLHN